MAPIVTDMLRAAQILEWACTKMDERYALFAEAGVRNIAAYNRLSREEIAERLQPTDDSEEGRLPVNIPYIVMIIDELADMMMTSKDVEHHLARLAQKSRAVGIHLIVATQRPSVNVVTGLIKSNLPCRISFRVASRQESRIVLDHNGAETLLGKGDMLLLPTGASRVIRLHSGFITEPSSWESTSAVLYDATTHSPSWSRITDATASNSPVEGSETTVVAPSAPFSMQWAMRVSSTKNWIRLSIVRTTSSPAVAGSTRQSPTLMLPNRPRS